MQSELANSYLGIVALWGKSWKILEKQWSSMLLVVFVLFVMDELIPLSMVKDIRFLEIAKFLVLLAFNSMLFLFISILVEDTVKNQPIGFKQAWRRVYTCFPGAVWTVVLGLIIVAFMSLLLIIPGIIWFMYYYFAFEVAALRGLNGKEALDYSKGLVKGRWWKVFGIIFCTAFLIIGIEYFVGFLLGIHLFSWYFFSSQAYFPGISGYVLSVVYSLLTVLFNIFITVLFLNLDYCRNNNSDANTPSELETSAK